MVDGNSATVARGPGGRRIRLGLACLAAVYYAFLIKSPPQVPGLRAATFFSEATCLFPTSNAFTIEFRLETWSCDTRTWSPMDPGTLFPIERASKESRFQRISYFYQRNREVLRALDGWVVDKLRDDGERIGGIRVVKVLDPIPAVGEPVEHYVYAPLAPIPADRRKDMYWTKASERKARCAVAR